jgi:hypothetical protein
MTVPVRMQVGPNAVWRSASRGTARNPVRIDQASEVPTRNAVIIPLDVILAFLALPSARIGHAEPASSVYRPAREAAH